MGGGKGEWGVFTRQCGSINGVNDVNLRTARDAFRNQNKLQAP